MKAVRNDSHYKLNSCHLAFRSLGPNTEGLPFHTPNTPTVSAGRVVAAQSLVGTRCPPGPVRDCSDSTYTSYPTLSRTVTPSICSLMVLVGGAISLVHK